MRARLVSVVCAMLGFLSSGCAHGPCRALGSWLGCDCVAGRIQPHNEDLDVKVPRFHSGEPGEVVIDGFTLRAVRIAASDFLEPEPDPKAGCSARQEAHEYRAIRKGDIVFVYIRYKPENCGERLGVLDGDVVYAVSVDGRILRRAPGSLLDEEQPPEGPKKPATIVPTNEVGTPIGPQEAPALHGKQPPASNKR